ncbi:hypothetical protein NHX12_005920 [Muraenolepis orangiensis]|uniref:Protein FAM92B n=1 Tax=Muraenolepis orangiensis TaxID=630683 RepID=A0A9Q0DSB8_9TELE|nr:hypothetical protein NHX12_005920 [Muraenolepis orangiensis]
MNSLFSRDVQVKGMEQTVNHAEKFLGHFCSLLASYTRKTAKLRDKADLLVTQLFDFSNTEDPEVQTGFKNLAEDLAMVQDYRQAQVERLETRVISPLKGYGDTIKAKRAELKKFSADRNRELKEIQKLEKVRLKNPADRQSIAEVSAQKASNNALRSTRQLEDTITDFQRQKLEDLKRIFTDFVTVEMLFHSKALEVYAHTLQNLETIDVYKDLELFSGRIRMPDPLSGPLDPMLTSRSTSSMSATASPTRAAAAARSLSPSLASVAHPRAQSWSSALASRRGQGHRQPRHEPSPGPARRIFTSSLQRQRGIDEEEEEEDEEEEEEEEDDEDMYESEMDEAQQTQRRSYASQYVQSRRQPR